MRVFRWREPCLSRGRTQIEISTDHQSRLETFSADGYHHPKLPRGCMRLSRPQRASTRPTFPTLPTFQQRLENISKLEDELCLMSRGTTESLSRSSSFLPSPILPVVLYTLRFGCLHFHECFLLLLPLTPPLPFTTIKAARLLLSPFVLVCIHSMARPKVLKYGLMRRCQLSVSTPSLKQCCPQKPQTGFPMARDRSQGRRDWEDTAKYDEWTGISTDPTRDPHTHSFSFSFTSSAMQSNYTLSGDPLSLDRIRSVLTRLEDTIIFGLIERAQFAHNPKIYQKGGFEELRKLDFKGSWLDWFLAETETFHGKFSWCRPTD